MYYDSKGIYREMKNNRSKKAINEMKVNKQMNISSNVLRFGQSNCDTVTVSIAVTKIKNIKLWVYY